MRLFLLSFFLLACSCDNPPAETRIDKIAQAFCECTGSLVALNQQTAHLATDTTAQANFQKNLRKIQEEYNHAKECSTTIIGQFGRLKKEEFAEVEKSLQVKCPELSKQRDLLREMIGE